MPLIGQAAARPKEPSAIQHRLEREHASAVLLDWNSGTTLFLFGGEPQATPGSAIKPLVLNYAISHGVARADTTVYCRRNLHIGGKPLPCTHPADAALLDARSALAESCNVWFAALGSRFHGPDLEAALRETHLAHTPMSSANEEQRQFAVLGLRGIEASPIALARAYRELLLHLPESNPVWQGMRDAVEYGMANPAHLQGRTILGKTGTASNTGQAWTHGWFAGGVPGRLVLAVYVPRGDGGDAARLAASLIDMTLKEGTR